VSERRIGTENSKTREVLLEAAEQLMRDEGYAAVTSRKIAEKAGLKPQLVHYYFRTMDELFLSVLERLTDGFLIHFARALASEKPLHALWEISSNPDGAALMTEFLALANHRKAIGAEIVRVNRRMRSMQSEAFKQILQRAGFDLEEFPPETMAVVLESIARGLAMESSLGITRSHDSTEALVKRYLSKFEI
jgi:AcrR family transcriptional regulator